jgi:hypothetical protein
MCLATPFSRPGFLPALEEPPVLRACDDSYSQLLSLFLRIPRGARVRCRVVQTLWPLGFNWRYNPTGYSVLCDGNFVTSSASVKTGSSPSRHSQGGAFRRSLNAVCRSLAFVGFQSTRCKYGTAPYCAIYIILLILEKSYCTLLLWNNLSLRGTSCWFGEIGPIRIANLSLQAAEAYRAEKPHIFCAVQAFESL